MTHRLRLREALVAYDSLVNEVLADSVSPEAVRMLGVEVLNLSIVAIKPTPETAKALEAEARELLLRQADEAIYSRGKRGRRPGANDQGERAEHGNYR